MEKIALKTVPNDYTLFDSISMKTFERTPARAWRAQEKILQAAHKMLILVVGLCLFLFISLYSSPFTAPLFFLFSFSFV
jgi:hypothetical protein